MDDAITSNKKTFAASVGGNVTDSLTAAFRSSKNEAMVQEQEREKRSANLLYTESMRQAREIQRKTTTISL